MKKVLVLVTALLMTVSFNAVSAELDKTKIKELMKQRFPSLNITLMEESKIPGFYAVEADGELIYLSKDGRFFIQGTAIDLETRVNLNNYQKAQWNNLKSPMRKTDIAKLAEKDMVVFKAPNEKHVISIFTDIDCGYCRKLHRERQDYLDRGITLRYLAFPRAGLQSSAAKKLEGIWCSTDRQVAMTNAKIKQKFNKASCENPIAEHMKLVRKFGLGGTPSIILENGDLIGGYQPAEVLIQRLDNIKAKAQASK
ncbi:thioredoxin fold domain-containing protein [Kangiella sp. HZ709]|uniref:thioredoxin fold domain-containing protein n=1 Tax=Kangiella sp. HZ709 TaxID=2666328 RepID=UPI0012B03DEA|nr:thioredoxin fold domain-containing protein [Kangiella sp. HZ709]MRX28407.1 thioredoxin fold domain-containing protein [Kangiella sp. HZ709]